MAAQHFQHYPSLVNFVSPNALDILNQLPYLHSTATNHQYVLIHLKNLAQHAPQISRSNMISIFNYLKKNLEDNIKIIQSLDCIVLFYHEFSISLRDTFSDILKVKYPIVDFDCQMTKLRAVNLSLIEPYLTLLRHLAMWHQMQLQGQPWLGVNSFEFSFIFNYFYFVSKFEFQTGNQLQGFQLYESLLLIYSLSQDTDNFYSYFLGNSNTVQKLVCSLFYFLGGGSSPPIEYARIIFKVIGQFIRKIEECNLSIEDEIFKELMPILRKEGEKIDADHQQLMNSIQNGVMGMLIAHWSLDEELKWSCLSKIIWDLLKADYQQQAQLLRDLQQGSRQIVKNMQLFD